MDTVEVSITPVLLGGGIALLAPPAQQAKLKLSGHRVYRSGRVLLVYERKTELLRKSPWTSNPETNPTLLPASRRVRNHQGPTNSFPFWTRASRISSAGLRSQTAQCSGFTFLLPIERSSWTSASIAADLTLHPLCTSFKRPVQLFDQVVQLFGIGFFGGQLAKLTPIFFFAGGHAKIKARR